MNTNSIDRSEICTCVGFDLKQGSQSIVGGGGGAGGCAEAKPLLLVT